MKNNNVILANLKHYFATTPREKVLADWARSKRFDRVGPTVNEFIGERKSYATIHTFRSLSTEEVMRGPSSAYKFINFDNPPYTEESFKITE